MKKIVLSIDFNPSYVIKIIGSIVTLTILLATISVFFRYSTFQSDMFGLATKFDMDEENTIPTFISSMNLLFAACILGLIAYITKKRNGKYWGQWGLMGAIFFAMAVDESASLHEGVASRFDMMMGGFEGTTHYAWAILGSALILGFLLYFRKFIMHLPIGARNSFIISGAIFLTGAIGVEAIGGLLYSQGGTETLIYEISVVLEEAFEMLGILYFISSLLSYVHDYLAREEVVSESVVLRIRPEVEHYKGVAQEIA